MKATNLYPPRAHLCLTDFSICALITMALLALTSSVVGTIPAHSGAGWDGIQYLFYIYSLGEASPVAGDPLQQIFRTYALSEGIKLPQDPYRAVRLSGFLPLILGSGLGMAPVALVALQLKINIVLLGLAAGFFYDALGCLNVRRSVAMLSTATLVASWVFLIVPVFYPILSDNIAIALSCISLWFWARKKSWCLYLAVAYGAWVMPGLFLVPLVLAAMPLTSGQHASTTNSLKTPRSTLAVFCLLAIALLYFMVPAALQIPLESIVKHGASGTGRVAIPELHSVSQLLFAVSVIIVAWVFARLITDAGIWAAVRWRYAFAAVLALGASLIAMVLLIDWGGGFRGPPLGHFMLLQFLAAPYKPVVAHFLTFGPAIILALATVIFWSFGCLARGVPPALLVIVSVFLPLLLFGSESRQWVGVWPIAVAFLAVSPYAIRTRVWCLAFSILLLIPNVWLQASTALAHKDGLGFQDEKWQFYFGHAGPWMSVDTYLYGLGLLALFVVVNVILYKWPAAKDKHIGNYR